MTLLPSNSFYSSFARKGKGTGNVPARSKSPFSFTGSLGHPNTGQVSGSALRPGASSPPGVSSGGPGGGGPAPSSPTSVPAGFTATPTGLPPDPAYQMTMGGLTQTKTDTIAGLQQQRGAGLQAYGYTEDPTTHAIAFDPNNPYSQAALLRKHYQQAKTGNQNTYADSGQGYAGSLSNAQTAATDSFNASDNTLTQAVINFLARNTQDTTAAGNQFNTNAGIALGQSVGTAKDNPLYSAVSGGGVGSVGPNGEIAVTAAPGGTALVPQSPNSSVQLAGGYTLVYPPGGGPPYVLDPSGNRVTGRVG